MAGHGKIAESTPYLNLDRPVPIVALFDDAVLILCLINLGC